MIRTQIQLPDELHREVKRIADRNEWSVTEVIRRGAETMVRLYPPTKAPGRPRKHLPPPLPAKLRITDAERLKATLRDDMEDHG